eukprot:gene10930-17817_t
MNYADQINAFMGDYNEVKNDFLQGESKQTQGAEQLMQQSDIEFGAVSAKEAVGKEAIAFGKKAYSAIKNAAATAERGHHEMKNVNSDFTMPESDVDLPSYHPGIN